ncbi:MAG: hypothetical protein ACKOI2_04150 [Actinomycetota bacterium]
MSIERNQIPVLDQNFMALENWNWHLLQPALVHQNLSFIEGRKLLCQLSDSCLTPGFNEETNEKGLVDV